jgi:hypothetical protein
MQMICLRVLFTVLLADVGLFFMSTSRAPRVFVVMRMRLCGHCTYLKCPIVVPLEDKECAYIEFRFSVKKKKQESLELCYSMSSRKRCRFLLCKISHMCNH